MLLKKTNFSMLKKRFSYPTLKDLPRKIYSEVISVTASPRYTPTAHGKMKYISLNS